MDHIPKTLTFPIEHTLYVLPTELIDNIIYFTENKVTELSLINKYFNSNVKKIRINSNIKYPKMTPDHLPLPNLTELDLSFHSTWLDYHTIGYKYPEHTKFTDQHLSKLTDLTSLDLSMNRIISNDGISSLTNLIKLNLANNSNISIEGISMLTNLVDIGLSANHQIDDISSFVNLIALNTNGGSLKFSDVIKQLPNLRGLNYSGDH